MSKNNIDEASDGGLPPRTGSPSSEAVDVVKIAVDLMKAGLGMSRAREKWEVKSWELIEALTADPGNFPKAVKIGEVDTDVAMLRIDGVTSDPLEILTGADGTYSVYADNYNTYGMPGRIIIDLGHGVTPDGVGCERIEELDDALRTLMNALDLYGGAASLTHPRLTRAMTAARKLIPENA